MRIDIQDTPASDRPFLGFGAETDPWERRFGDERTLDTAAVEMVERRLSALRPAVARMFTNVENWDPDLTGDPDKFVFDDPGHADVIAMARHLDRIGCALNVTLFMPFKVPTEQLPTVARSMVRMLSRFREEEGLGNIRWLTLYNEPEGYFTHDSPLVRTIFGDDRIGQWHMWEDYVDLNRRTAEMLEDAGLGDIRLAVCDSAWGGRMRRERMELSARDFADMDVMYSYHHYNPEYREFYETAPDAFQYDGAAQEASAFRELVGPDAQLGVWEFNNAGARFSTHFAGVDRHGMDSLSSPACGAELTEKIFRMCGSGVDCCCLWHLHDSRTNKFGLWRSKDQGFIPRPYYHYYAALCNAYRPGMRILRAEVSEPEGALSTLAARDDDRVVLGVVNHSDAVCETDVAAPFAGRGRMLRLHPKMLPMDDDLPYAPWRDRDLTGEAFRLKLEPYELVLWDSTQG